MYSRICPQCQSEIWHGKKENRDRGLRRNQLCMSCSRKKPIDPDMTHKICRRCGESKEVSQFSRRMKSPDGLQDRCRQCNTEQARENYRANPERYAKLAIQRNEELKKRIRQLKNVPCVDCGQSFDPVCMDFDHLPEFTKSMDISLMMRHRFSWEKILAETRKCEVVCANCHRLRTKARGHLG